MKDRRKDGKKKRSSSDPYESSQGLRRKRLKPASKSKYKINRYQLSEDFEEEDDPGFDHYSDDED